MGAMDEIVGVTDTVSAEYPGGVCVCVCVTK